MVRFYWKHFSCVGVCKANYPPRPPTIHLTPPTLAIRSQHIRSNRIHHTLNLAQNHRTMHFTHIPRSIYVRVSCGLALQKKKKRRGRRLRIVCRFVCTLFFFYEHHNHSFNSDGVICVFCHCPLLTTTNFLRTQDVHMMHNILSSVCMCLCFCLAYDC